MQHKNGAVDKNFAWALLISEISKTSIDGVGHRHVECFSTKSGVLQNLVGNAHVGEMPLGGIFGRRETQRNFGWGGKWNSRESTKFW